MGELKIRDVGGNILVFKFDNSLDLERVLEFDTWPYDKNLVIFQRTKFMESTPSLDFSVTSFRVQLHNVPKMSLT